MNNQTELERILASLPLAKLARGYESLLALTLFLLFWGGLVLYSGTLTAGFHLIDDWELPGIHEALRDSNLFTVTTNYVRTDLGIRFRPWYYTQRIFTLWLLGLNTTALSAVQLATVVFSCLLLYLFARTLRFGGVTSFLFPLLTFLGPQAAIWWRLGTAESIGIAWFALGLLFMAKATDIEQGRRTLHSWIAATSFILASLTKESFIAALPVVSLAWLMLYARSHRTGIVETLRACVAPLVLAVVTLGEVAAIFFSGTSSTIGYAGVDSQSLSLQALFQTLKSLVTSSNGKWIVFVLALLFVVLLAALRKGIHGTVLKELASVALLVSLFVASQVFVYAKSGIFERYLIPGTLPLAFLAVYLIAKIDALLTTQRLRLAVSTLLVLGTILALRPHVASAWTAAKTYAEECVTFRQALENVDSSTAKDDIVLLVADPARDFEASIGIREYLRTLFRRTRVFVLPIWALPEASYSAFDKQLGKSYETDLGEVHFDKLADKTQIKAILTCPFGAPDNAFRQRQPDWFDPAKFARSEFGKFVVYAPKP